MKTKWQVAAITGAFVVGGLISLSTGASAEPGTTNESVQAAATSLPSPAEIGNLYGFPVQDGYEGCRNFAEFADPTGFCIDNAHFTDGESSLVGRAITGREMTEDEAQIAASIIEVQQMRVSDASAADIDSADSAAKQQASAWWETNFDSASDGARPAE